MKTLIAIFILLNFFINNLAVQDATIKKVKMKFKTYMFSDPDPIPKIGHIYPYFRFDGYTNRGIEKEWNMIVLENDYIKVFVCPDIGGKVWGAVEKSTGKEFLYFNHVVKFRDIAMRGAWTSGGLEFNFGDIGHIPTCATPVDYIIDQHSDGSVSCTVGAIDLPSNTKWNVKISLQKNQAFFKTKTFWVNNTSLPVTYYHWMNAAAKSKGNLEFFFPGGKRIGHGGEPGNWPVENGIKISDYEKNTFGIYKSYHVLNSYSNFFGGYWHDENFGFGHLADFDEKPGKKLWIWGLSDQGMIWEDLLTDTDGQYIEYQAGKLFNQAAEQSTFSPFKHREFSSHDSDIMYETWFPFKNTGGMTAASEYAVLNVVKKNNQVQLLINPLQKLNTDLKVQSGGKTILSEKLNLKPLELYKKSFQYKKQEFSVHIGNDLLRYSTKAKDHIIDRPLNFNKNFNWDSAYGLYTKALELEKQRKYSESKTIYLKCLKIESTFLPGISRIALQYYREMNYQQAGKYAKTALSIDTYAPLANFVLGLTSICQNDISLAKNGFSIASQSLEYRSAAYTELAKLFLREQNFSSALKYAKKALTFNSNNTTILRVLSIIHRIKHQNNKSFETLKKLSRLDPLDHFINFEKYKLKKTGINYFKNQISNELPFESYLDLAIFYNTLGCRQEAIEVLNCSPEHPIIYLWLSYLDTTNQKNHLTKALDQSAKMIFPHRIETAKILEHFRQSNSHWKLKYYSGLIYWNKGLLQKAKNMFKLCKDQPDFAPFYLAKIKLFKKDKQIKLPSLIKAKKLAPSNWRVNLAWIEYYINSKNFKKAEKIAKTFLKKFPENSTIAIIYAKTLFKNSKFKSCVSFLEKYRVLPFEGATETRLVYHSACIKSALNELKKKNYLKVIEFAKKAKLWPKNLGVGRPYDVDERLDDFLIGLGLEKLNKQSEAKKYFDKIKSFTLNSYLKENSKLLLQLLIFKKSNQGEKAQKLVNNISKKYPDNPYIKWVNNIYLNPDQILNSQSIPLGKGQAEDKDFELVKTLIKMLRSEIKGE